MFQNLYDKAKEIVNRDACMKFYDMVRPLYLTLMDQVLVLDPDSYR